MHSLILPTITLLSTSVLAGALPSSPSYPHHASDSGAHNGQCTSFYLPVAVNTTGVDYHFPPIDNKYEVTQWAVSASTWSAKPPPPTNVTIDQTFNIYAQLCVPRNGAKKNILQLATHGLYFDMRYWDASIDPPQYSYVYNALQAGYSILTYDRLTTGKSEKPNGYVIAQGATEVEILRGITEMVRSGDIAQYMEHLEDELKFESIVHVGHSFGSYITNALLALYGELSDGAVLTGFIPVEHQTFEPVALGFDFARTNDPKFADRPDGYFVPALDIDIQTGFFSALRNTTLGIGGFEPALLELANNTKQPGTVGEQSTLPMLTEHGPAGDFTGPVRFVEGEFDYIICGGNCHDYNMTAIETTYANAKDIEVYLQPGTGHGSTLHRNASIWFHNTFEFLDRNGL